MILVVLREVIWKIFDRFVYIDLNVRIFINIQLVIFEGITKNVNVSQG